MNFLNKHFSLWEKEYHNQDSFWGGKKEILRKVPWIQFIKHWLDGFLLVIYFLSHYFQEAYIENKEKVCFFLQTAAPISLVGVILPSQN